MKNKEALVSKLEQSRLGLKIFEKALQEEEEPLDKDPHYVKVSEEIWELKKELNKAPVPTAPKGFTIGIVISVIAIIAGLFTTFYLFIAGVAALIVFLILRSSFLSKAQRELDIIQAPTKNKLRELNDERQEMRDKYPKIGEIENEIQKLNTIITDLETEINQITKEEDALKSALGTNNPSIYEKNYIFIHVGRKSKDIPGAGILSHKVLIDGENLGAAQLPFAKFEMNPGIHNIRVEYKWGDNIYETRVVQARVDQQSKMIAFKLISGSIEIKEFDNFADFLNYIKNY